MDTPVMKLGDGDEMTLANWLLLDPPGPDELDERGCFSHQAITDLESPLLDSVAVELEAYEEKAASVTMVPDNRWALVSSLQKAVRFGLPDHAAWVADQLYALDRKALHRRLGVIAIEDVLLGDPMVVAQALAILGAGAWRQEHGEQRTYRWVARRLAEADGDRSAAELLDSGHSDERVVWSELNSMSEEEMARVVGDPGQPFALRSAVAQLMAGPKFAIGKMPTTPWRSPTPLFRLMVEMGATRWGCYVASKTASRVRSSMWTQIPIIDRWLREETRTVVPGPVPPTRMIGGVISAAWDMHTRPGLQAIKRLSKLPAIAMILDGVVYEERADALKLALFYAEGGVVARRAVYGAESEEVHRWLRLGPEWVKWRRPELAPELIPAVVASLDDLNAMREQILGRAFGADVDESRNEGTR